MKVRTASNILSKVLFRGTKMLNIKILQFLIGAGIDKIKNKAPNN